MKLCFGLVPLLCGPLFVFAAAQSSSPASTAPSGGTPVPYASVSQLNLVLSDLQQSSQTTQLDLAKLRIDKWKTDGNTKRDTTSDVESIQRNLQSALPGIVDQLRASPENLTATFKLYRNLDALYDVFGSVVESAGAFGSKDEFQSLQNDLSAFQRSRKSVADRMETLSDSKEGELSTLRTQLQAAKAAAEPSAPPKKVVVDDTEPPKKTVKKKTATKTPKPPVAAPANNTGSNPQTPAQQSPSPH